jgi:Domain of unknown function (DUF4335)
MSLPNSIVRRYTPPTCTLEVAAKESPLSRWVGQPVLKHLRFHLRFDDPRVSEDKWVKVQGDRTQLEALYEAVTTYVQEFLQSTHDLIPPTATIYSVDSRTSSTALMLSQSHATLSQPHPLTANSPISTELAQPPEFSLKSKGLLVHELSLGTLATPDSGATIQLSAVQLADLATALDEYRADVTALPNLNRPSWVKPSPAWARIAAICLIFVGGSTSLVRLFEPTPSSQPTSPTSSQGASSADQRLAVQPFSSPTPSASPAFPPLVAVPTPATNSKVAKSSVPPTPAAASPIKLPTVTVPQKAPTTPTPEETALKIADPLPASSVEGQAVPPLITAKPASAGDRAAPPPTAAAAAPVTSSTAKENATVFDTTPQVAEVRTYFQANWQPPEGLSENLDYSLIITANGAVQEIIPLTKVSENFRDRVTMPPPGAPFLSPIKNGGNLRIRLVLSPDGKVQTFPEPPNGQ